MHEKFHFACGNKPWNPENCNPSMLTVTTQWTNSQVAGKVTHQIDPSDKYPTMRYFISEMFTHLLISVTKWYIVGYEKWRYDVTMVDECKQSTTTPSTHMKKNCQVNTFHDGLTAWMGLYRHCVCVYIYTYPESCLKYAFSVYKAKYGDRIGETPWWSWCYLIFIITRGLFYCNARLFNDNVTAIGVSYWRRREFPNYARSIVVEYDFYLFPFPYVTVPGIPIRTSTLSAPQLLWSIPFGWNSLPIPVFSNIWFIVWINYSCE